MNESNDGAGNTAVGRDIRYTSVESDPSLHCFCKLSLSWELGSSLWTSEHASYKKNWCSQGDCTSLSTLNKKLLSTFNFVPKINEFLSKISPISHTFVKHKRYWPFNIRQSFYVKRDENVFRSFLKFISHLKIFFVIRVSNCCSASLLLVYLTA